MATTCDGCGRAVTIAGGTPNLWQFGSDRPAAFTLELEDGTEYLICGPCLEELPESPTAASIDQLERVDGETSRRR